MRSPRQRQAAEDAAPAAAPAFTAGTRSSFASSSEVEPHALRRRQLLAAHPELRELSGYCPLTKFKIAFVVGLQLASASQAAVVWREAGLGALCALAWLWGGFLTSNLFLASHEVSHNLAAATPRDNKLLGLLGAAARRALY